MALPPPTRYLVCPTGASISPDLLATAVAEVATGNCYVHVILPAVLPATMPISAYPPRLAERLERLRIAAVRAVREPMRRGRVEILPCRSVQSAIGQALGRGAPAEIVLVGTASWRLRRSLRHVGRSASSPAGPPRGPHPPRSHGRRRPPTGPTAARAPDTLFSLEDVRRLRALPS
jgi:hypothetical protein